MVLGMEVTAVAHCHHSGINNTKSFYGFNNFGMGGVSLRRLCEPATPVWACDAGVALRRVRSLQPAALRRKGSLQPPALRRMRSLQHPALRRMRSLQPPGMISLQLLRLSSLQAWGACTLRA